ncbi:MAG TPA: aldo/keto reductase [Actinomycetota bacterium]|nr:aldo/keto reductase [Actinomycetota bacterium]
MEYRRLGKTGFRVSAVGFGAWAIGADWGDVAERDAIAALHTAADAGVTFFDTADVYGDGRSERLIGRFIKERGEDLVVATKIGRRAPLDLSEYSYERFRDWVDRSRKNLGMDILHLVQLHSLLTDVYYRPEIFQWLDELVAEDRIAHYGVSVERVEEALKAIQFPGVATVQIIFNIFRQRPADLFFNQASLKDAGIIARVPLASGLLTGKFGPSTTFPPNDHRNFNRHGDAFDIGETFAGVDFDTGIKVVEEIHSLVPKDMTLAQFALKWILMHPEVSTVIPGAKNPRQARDNAAAADKEDLDQATMECLSSFYRDEIAPQVHHRW